jgi:hypothetical protein
MAVLPLKATARFIEVERKRDVMAPGRTILSSEILETLLNSTLRRLCWLS